MRTSFCFLNSIFYSPAVGSRSTCSIKTLPIRLADLGLPTFPPVSSQDITNPRYRHVVIDSDCHRRCARWTAERWLQAANLSWYLEEVRPFLSFPVYCSLSTAGDKPGERLGSIQAPPTNFCSRCAFRDAVVRSNCYWRQNQSFCHHHVRCTDHDVAIRFIGVTDLAAVRFSLPSQLLEPTPNLEYWTYLDAPNAFIAIGTSSEPLDRMLEVIRFWLTKDLKYAKGKPCKPYNSCLGEFFRVRCTHKHSMHSLVA